MYYIYRILSIFSHHCTPYSHSFDQQNCDQLTFQTCSLTVDVNVADCGIGELVDGYSFCGMKKQLN